MISPIAVNVNCFWQNSSPRSEKLGACSFCLVNITNEVISILIKQTRINSYNYFASAIPDTPIYIRVEDVGRFKTKTEMFGFKKTDQNGTTILPCGVNRYAKKNAEPYFTIDKSLPKEDYTQTVYWTRYEWAGKGQLNPVTDFSYIKKQRYHRDYFQPYSVYFTLVTDGDKPYIISDAIPYITENREKLLNTVNMLLGMFGECTVDFSEQESQAKRILVNWDILPKGEYPWSTVRETLGNLTKGSTKTHAELMLRNCESIYARNPDFVAYGRSGFKGYAVFDFTSRDLYILESAIPNNATYVLQNNWETISQLSKAEILSQELHKARIIHSASWQKNFNEMMEDKNG